MSQNRRAPGVLSWLSTRKSQSFFRQRRPSSDRDRSGSRGGNAAPIFGIPLQVIVADPERSENGLPVVMSQCLQVLQRKVKANEVLDGVFRVPGNHSEIQEFKELYDTGKFGEALFVCEDVHVIASLFKLYLRELPEPVIPFSDFPEFLKCTEALSEPPTSEQLKRLKARVETIPSAHRTALLAVVRMLHEISQDSARNLMTPQNLAVVIGPGVLRPQSEDPLSNLQNSCLVNKCMEVMIQYYPAVFAPNDLRRRASSRLMALLSPRNSSASTKAM